MSYYATASESEKETFRTWLGSMLRMGPVQLTFTKKDGNERVLNGTLQEDKIPAYENKTGRHRDPNPEVISVVDIDIGEWRAVRYDSIKEIRIEL